MPFGAFPLVVTGQAESDPCSYQGRVAKIREVAAYFEGGSLVTYVVFHNREGTMISAEGFIQAWLNGTSLTADWKFIECKDFRLTHRGTAKELILIYTVGRFPLSTLQARAIPIFSSCNNRVDARFVTTYTDITASDTFCR